MTALGTPRRLDSLGAGLAVAVFFAAALAPAIAASADPPAAAQPPFWAEKGVFVYRVSTPDADDVLQRAEEALAMTSHLLDDSVPQITILGGLVGHDHTGAANWDGLWPDWNRVNLSRRPRLAEAGRIHAPRPRPSEHSDLVSRQSDRRERRPGRLS